MKTMQQQAVAESAVTSIENSLDFIKKAYTQTTNEQLKQELRQQWNGLCGLLKKAQEEAKVDENH